MIKQGQSIPDRVLLRVGLTVISTSGPSTIKKSISRSTEKLPERLRIRAETWAA